MMTVGCGKPEFSTLMGTDYRMQQRALEFQQTVVNFVKHKDPCGTPLRGIDFV